MITALYIILPLIFLSRLLFIPCYLSLLLLTLGAVLPPMLFRGVFTISLLLATANYVHLLKFNRSIALGSLRLIFHIRDMKDSIEISMKHLLLLALIICYTILIPIHDIPFMPLLLISILLLPIFILFLHRNKAAPAEKTYKFTPENELFSYRSKEYPLEKQTKGFTGEKLFTLPGNRPHVITIFLESFRGENVGALGGKDAVSPNFDKLCEEGILFTNFHSNATQSFKAFYHILYGLPAFYGSEFQSSAKTVTHLNLSGLPDLFKQDGYEPVFMQGGSNQFEFQGEFIENHGYCRLYDTCDIKKDNPKAHGTSWGVHDSYLYEFLLKTIKESNIPLFLNAATISNHHPFRAPKGFHSELSNRSDDPLYNRFLQTMHYSDLALGNFVKKLKSLNQAVHLYIMGDHGFDREGIKQLKQSINKSVTHVPLLILPIGCGKIESQKIHDTSSHIDLVPTMMDIYGLKGTNSAIGSSLVRKRKNPHALVLNQIALPALYGEIKGEELTLGAKKEAFETLEYLYHKKAISSKKDHMKALLDFSSEKITHPHLVQNLQKHKDLSSLILNECMLIHTLNLPYPSRIQRIELDGNLFIDDEEMRHLPKNLQALSILRCKNLTDKSLLHLSKLPLKELSFSSTNFTKEALDAFSKTLYSIEKIYIDNGENITSSFFQNLPKKTVTDIKIGHSIGIDDNCLLHLTKQPIKVLLLSDCRKLTDKGLSYLKNSLIECLLLENAINITDNGVYHLQHIPLHTFSISHAEHITEHSIDNLNSDTLQGVYCMGCNIKERVEEKLIGKTGVQLRYFVNESDFLHGQKIKAFEKNSRNIFLFSQKIAFVLTDI